jgi:hypothetical protein
MPSNPQKRERTAHQSIFRHPLWITERNQRRKQALSYARRRTISNPRASDMERGHRRLGEQFDGPAQRGVAHRATSELGARGFSGLSRARRLHRGALKKPEKIRLKRGSIH